MDNLKKFITLFGAGLGLMVLAIIAIYQYAIQGIAVGAICIATLLSNIVERLAKKINGIFDKLK